MMAKMFYTLDETKAALGKNEEEIKQLAREGRLREFRDGPRLMFKADQVESLKAELGGGIADQVDLGPSDSGGPLGLIEGSGSGSGIALEDSGSSGKKEDTALAADLGLSGSLGGSLGGGTAAPGRSGAGSGLTNTSTGTGVTVFRPDEVGHVDPGAQTAITSGIPDQVNLESVGSGSGLLDLTRESDDTSLGAELLDEITPGGSAAGTPGKRQPSAGADAAARTGVEMEAMSGAASGRVIAPPQYVEAIDSLAPAFGWAAAAAGLFVLFGGFVVISAVLGYHPAMIDGLRAKGLTYLGGIGLVVCIVAFVVGLFIGKAGAKR